MPHGLTVLTATLTGGAAAGAPAATGACCGLCPVTAAATAPAAGAAAAAAPGAVAAAPGAVGGLGAGGAAGAVPAAGLLPGAGAAGAGTLGAAGAGGAMGAGGMGMTGTTAATAAPALLPSAPLLPQSIAAAIAGLFAMPAAPSDMLQQLRSGISPRPKKTKENRVKSRLSSINSKDVFNDNVGGDGSDNCDGTTNAADGSASTRSLSYQDQAKEKKVRQPPFPSSRDRESVGSVCSSTASNNSTTDYFGSNKYINSMSITNTSTTDLSAGFL